MKETKAFILGVNQSNDVRLKGWGPQVHDQAQKVETLLVDARGKPLLIRQPRKIGFYPR